MPLQRLYGSPQQPLAAKDLDDGGFRGRALSRIEQVDLQRLIPDEHPAEPRNSFRDFGEQVVNRLRRGARQQLCADWL